MMVKSVLKIHQVTKLRKWILYIFNSQIDQLIFYKKIYMSRDMTEHQIQRCIRHF